MHFSNSGHRCVFHLRRRVRFEIPQGLAIADRGNSGLGGVSSTFETRPSYNEVEGDALCVDFQHDCSIHPVGRTLYNSITVR